MKFEELFEQMDQIKEAFMKAKEEFNCDEVELVFKTDEGKIIPINVIEGGYAPLQNTNMLVFSSGMNVISEMLEAMMKTPTINADNIDVGAKLEEFLDEDH